MNNATGKKRRSQQKSTLMVEDDPDDRLLVEEAFRENRRGNELYFVKDGEELLNYLHHLGNYSDAEKYPTPDLILLDLNLPRMDGREALAELKADHELRRIPVVVLTTSQAEEDVWHTYDLGVAGFITKPVTFEGLVEVIRTLSRYWFDIVELPRGEQVKRVSTNHLAIPVQEVAFSNERYGRDES